LYFPRYFEYQLQLSKEFRLPLFLHCRAAADDLVDILHRNQASIVGGVVHSFDGSQEALEKILALGLYVGINGW
jgi:TatD DNase family protein